MDSRELIDVQFDRAVEIVQGLPKNGPIQTDYEEKLTMYSLYKQATVGNVTTSRPGIFDMLGRAKWDAWAKHKDLDSYEAKWLYVDALMKVLKKYPDKPLAQEMLAELESYAGDPAHILMSRTMSRGSNSSGSSTSEVNPTPYSAHFQSTVSPRYYQNPQMPMGSLPENAELSTSDDEDDSEDEDPRGLTSASLYHDATQHQIQQQQQYQQPQSQRQRPISSMSGHRYRTPMTGSTMVSPPPQSMSVPAQQPLPRFESQSAFDESPSTGTFLPAVTSYPSHLAPSSRSDVVRGAMLPPSAGASTNRRLSTPLPLRPASRPTIEGAVENVQAHLAALTERLESLEMSTMAFRSSASLGGGTRSPNASGTSDGRAGRSLFWDMDDMGLWSLVIKPAARITEGMRHVVAFLAVNEHRTPTLVVVRRLFLDISFLLCALAVFKLGWKKTGIRRAEIVEALRILGRAVAGQKRPRVMINKSV